MAGIISIRKRVWNHRLRRETAREGGISELWANLPPSFAERR